jgi:hypothetical protein
VDLDFAQSFSIQLVQLACNSRIAFGEPLAPVLPLYSLGIIEDARFFFTSR